jgi:hypothetical protein
MGKLTVNVSDEVYRALKKQSSIKNRSIASILEEAVRASECFPIPIPSSQSRPEQGTNDSNPLRESKPS